jgi:hypothetical protein
MSYSMRTLVAATAMVVALLPQVAQSRDVKRCGITIAAGKTGKLVQDVQCGYRCTTDPTVRCKLDRDDYRCPLDNGGCSAEQIFIERNATLDLNGFDLSAAYGHDTVVCSAGSRTRCTIKGPGTFFAWKAAAITPNDRDVILKDLTIDHDYDGFTTAGWVRATNVVLQSCSSGMMGRAGASAKNVHIGASCGIYSGRNLYLDNVFIADSASAAGTVRAKDVTVANGVIGGRDVFLKRSHVPLPLDTTPISFRASVIAERRLVLLDSTVGGIESGLKPALKRSSCVQSRKLGTQNSWGVCAID